VKLQFSYTNERQNRWESHNDPALTSGAPYLVNWSTDAFVGAFREKEAVSALTSTTQYQPRDEPTWPCSVIGRKIKHADEAGLAGFLLVLCATTRYGAANTTVSFTLRPEDQGRLQSTVRALPQLHDAFIGIAKCADLSGVMNELVHINEQQTR
jgi:hypothetical protein